MADLASVLGVDPAYAPPPPGGAGQYPVVGVHPSPDGRGFTNLSDEDYTKFNAGIAPPPSKDGQGNGIASALGVDDLHTFPEAPVQPKGSGALANMGAGTSETVANTLGMPVDAVTGAINLIPRGINAVAGTNLPTIDRPVLGSDWWKSAEGLIGADPRNVVAATPTERMTRAAGQGAATMVLPWAAARAAPAMGGLVGAAQDMLGSGSAAGQAAMGAVSGASGQLAEEAAPEPLKPLANFGGQMLGGTAAALTGAAAKGALDVGGRMAGNFSAPFTESGRERLAGQRILSAAYDPTAVQEALAAPKPQLVPGSQPTTYQLTGDAGLGNLERAVAKESPDQFLARTADQNRARVAAVEGAQPEGSPEAVGRSFIQQLDAINEAGNRVAAGAQGRAQQATAALGNAPPVGADAQDTALQRWGQSIRGGLDTLNQQRKAAVSQLYASVDPDGTLAVDMRPFKEKVAEIAAGWPKNAKPLQGEAGAVFGVSRMQPAVQKFSEVGALRQRIGDAMAAARGNPELPQEYRQLTMLRGALDDTLSGAVAEKAAQDAGNQRGVGVLGGNAEQSADQSGSGALNRENDGGVQQGAGSQGQVFGGPGEQVSAGAGRGDGGGSGAIPAGTADAVAAPAEPSLTPNFDAGALERRRAADAAHAERMQTYGQNVPGVGPVLAPGSRPGDFRMGASQVPANLFMPGKGGAERIQAVQRAAAGNPQIMRDLQDYAAFSFRRAAENADGTIDPAKAAKWQQAHSEVMGAFPELESRFGDAIAARQAMDEAAARQAARVKDFQTAAVSKFMGDADPVQTVGRILNSDTALAQMQDLARKTAGDPAAREGLRRAVVEHILDNLRSNQLADDTRVLKNDAFQTFVRKTPAALRTVFSADEVANIKAVAEDLQRSQKSVSGTKLPGGSNTAQDLAAGRQHTSHGPSLLNTVVAMEVGGEVMHHIANTGIAKVVGMVAAPIVNAMRSVGMSKVDELVTQAMLNPALAKTLLSKVPRSDGGARSAARLLSGQIRALALANSVSDARMEQKP